MSLLEVLQFYAGLFYMALGQLARLETDIAGAIEARGGEDFITQQETEKTYEVLQFIKREAERAQLEDAIRMGVMRLTGIHPKMHNAVTLNKLRWELDALHHSITSGLHRKMFMLIPDDKVEYWDEHRRGENRPKHTRLPPLFGPKVHRNFKSTRKDVAEAGNCFATGRYTACVFHCSRVVEKGLHALVGYLNATYATNIIFPKPIDELNWGTIIPKVRAEIDKLIDPSRQPRLSKADAKFLSELASEFRYFQVAWRDDVAHSRSWFDDPNETKAVLEHSKIFMQRLAVRVKE